MNSRAIRSATTSIVLVRGAGRPIPSSWTDAKPRIRGRSAVCGTDTNVGAFLALQQDGAVWTATVARGARTIDEDLICLFARAFFSGGYCKTGFHFRGSCSTYTR